MEAKQVAQQEAERARFVVEKVSAQPDGRSPSPPSSCAPPPGLLGGLEIHHLSSLLPGHRKGIEGTLLLQLVPESLGSSQGYVGLCS